MNLVSELAPLHIGTGEEDKSSSRGSPGGSDPTGIPGASDAMVVMPAEWEEVGGKGGDGDSSEELARRSGLPPEWELQTETALRCRVQVPRPLSVAPGFLLGRAGPGGFYTIHKSSEAY